MRIYFLLLLILLSNGKSFATAQFPDVLIVDGDTVGIHSNPLEIYFNQKGKRSIGNLEMFGSCTALWRGYVATWKIENDSLFLVGVEINSCSDNPTQLDITPEFGSDRVWANWDSIFMLRPKGEMLQYIHMGYGSLFEKEVYYTFDKGILVKTESKLNVEYEEGKFLPGRGRLFDTIRGIILRSLDKKERALAKDREFMELSIRFNQEGRIDEITAGDKPSPIEKVAIQNAREALRDFPQLMKVKEIPRFRYAPINLMISGYCLKNPYDREYGCDDE